MVREKVTKLDAHPYSKAPVTVEDIDALTLEMKALITRIFLLTSLLALKMQQDVENMKLAAALLPELPQPPPDTKP
jgi:hypothetical protein